MRGSWFIKFVTCAGLVFVLCGLGAVYLVWPSDVWSGRTRVIEGCRLPDGQRIALVQYWGRDFYTLELVHSSREGRVMRSVVLDGDAPRTRRGGLHWDGSAKVVHVRAGRITGSYDPAGMTFTRSDGAIFSSGAPTRDYEAEGVMRWGRGAAVE